MAGDRLSVVFVEAAIGGTSRTFVQLLDCDELTHYREDPLGAIAYLKTEADRHRIDIEPPLSHAEPGTVFVFRRRHESDFLQVGREIQELVSSGELVLLELKSTLWLDINRQRNNPNATNESLKSKAVCQSAMKSICGFLNESGGKLVIGIGPDAQEIVGVESEFFVACPDDRTIDGWCQAFRTAIDLFFHEPNAVRNQIALRIGKIGDKFVVLVDVVKRRKMSFCKCAELREYRVYTRRSTSSEVVALVDIEQYVENRRDRHRNDDRIYSG